MPTDLITNGFFSFWFLCFPPLILTPFLVLLDLIRQGV
jgi:hypothetical protein